MKKLVVAHLITKEILRTVDCPEEDVSLNIPADCAGFVIENSDNVSNETHYLNAQNVLTRYSNVQIENKVNRPPWAQKWDNSAMQWIDSRTLDHRKAQKWEEIKLARATAIYKPLVTPFGTYDADEAGQDNITKSVLLAQTLTSIGQPVAIVFTLANNSVVTLDLTAMVTVGLMLGNQVQTARGIATFLRTQIEAVTTASQLDAITWPV